MRLLVACCVAIKQKELKKVNSSNNKQEVEDSVPLVTFQIFDANGY